VDADPYSRVVGQDQAVDRLRSAARQPVHAYLLVGQPGAGSAAAALGFAAELLSAGLDGEGAARAVELALAGSHPDLVSVEAQGAALRVSEAEFIITAASTSPLEHARKVLLIHRIDVIEEEAVGKLLKIIEEPPASTVFIALAGELTPELTTIASRCVNVEFGPLSAVVIENQLLAEGVDAGKAALAASAAGGDLDRARLLATDTAIANRAELWRTLPERLNGTGHAAYDFTQQIRAAMDQAAEPLARRHAQVLAELDRRAEDVGERGLGRAKVIASHKREMRKLRTDELRFGLATLSRVYRDRLLLGSDPQAVRAIERTQFAADELIRNPNEALFLQSLLLDLSP
jgi:DNA polymerase-3 subunit delta'